MIALLSVTAVTYAAFPVQKNVAQENTIPASSDSEPDWLLLGTCFIGFAGIAGIHRFIIGDYLNGILMLLTAGFCGIWTLIDFIRIAQGKITQ